MPTQPGDIDHNIRPGPITACQVCGSNELEVVIDLGHQPLCDTLPNDSQVRDPEVTYPLRQVRCKICTLSQLDYIVDANEIYHPAYPYRTGVTRELADYQEAMARELIEGLSPPAGSLVVDIGSNDGTLLGAFRNGNMRVVGVEPTNIAQFAIDAGIETIQDFFGPDSASSIVESHGQAKIVTATNVFAHVAALGDFINGLEVLVGQDGYFVLENHYLPAILRHGQFDTIYHEHLRSYSLQSIVTLFDQYDFTVVSAREVSRYGGNIRVIVQKGRDRTVEPSVEALLNQEAEFGLLEANTYENFRMLAERSKLKFLEMALSAKSRGESFVGNSCPARASTLLNYFGIGQDLMPYIAEQPTSMKLGLNLPGKHIPIVSNQILIDQQPDWVVLLAWHYAEPIARQLRERGLRSNLIVPLPEPHILEI
jgi:hypothetical protein